MDFLEYVIAYGYMGTMIGAPLFLIWRFVRALKHRNRVVATQVQELRTQAESLRLESQLLAADLVRHERGGALP